MSFRLKQLSRLRRGPASGWQLVTRPNVPFGTGGEHYACLPIGRLTL